MRIFNLLVHLLVRLMVRLIVSIDGSGLVVAGTHGAIFSTNLAFPRDFVLRHHSFSHVASARFVGVTIQEDLDWPDPYLQNFVPRSQHRIIVGSYPS